MDSEIEDYFKSIKTDEICRTCLFSSEEMISLYTKLDAEEYEENLTSLHHILSNVTSIKIMQNDGLPILICKNCAENLNTAFQFKSLCEKSEHLLKTYLAKVETEKQINDIKVFVVNDHDYITKHNENPETHDEVIEIDDDYSDDCSAFVEVLEEEFQTENTNSPNTDNVIENKEEINSESKNLDSVKTKPKPKTKKRKANYYDFYINEDGVKMFKCKDCDKEYKYAANLTIHIRTHTDERPYECKICSKRFRQITSLKHHMRCHTGETPYECKLCGKRYRQSCSLTAHMRIHTGQRPFVCSVCNKGFRQKPDLRYHMRTHTKEKPYMCSICGKRMSMQCHLVQHMRTHTGEKPYPCKVCGKSFPSSTRLRRHEIVHSDEKPFACEICKRCFNRLNSLKMHLLTHSGSGIRPHVCPVCDKSFIQKHELKKHLTTHYECDSEEQPVKKKVTVIKSIVNKNVEVQNI